MNTAALLLGLLGAPTALAETPELGRFDHAGAMLAVPMGWLIGTDEKDGGGIAEVRQSQSRLSPVLLLEWGDAGDRTADAIVDERAKTVAAEMSMGSASETARVDFGDGGRRATLSAGMLGVSVPIEVAARVVEGRYLVAVFTGPPASHAPLGASAMVEQVLTRSVWSGELPPVSPKE